MKAYIILLILTMVSPTLTQAQTVPDWGETYTPEPPAELGYDIDNVTLPDAPDAVPVDGGLGLLGAAGLAYALRRLRIKE